MPSREHFLLNLLMALSTDSFSPTLMVDIPLTTLLRLRTYLPALFGELLYYSKEKSALSNIYSKKCALF